MQRLYYCSPKEGLSSIRTMLWRWGIKPGSGLTFFGEFTSNLDRRDLLKIVVQVIIIVKNHVLYTSAI